MIWLTAILVLLQFLDQPSHRQNFFSSERDEEKENRITIPDSTQLDSTFKQPTTFVLEFHCLT